jgi:NAD(P)-dependent dehydrogenase (short-subunit alcohol dehydrogenase family)
LVKRGWAGRLNENAKRMASKVALISGAARGLGASEAELFAGHGAKVVIGDILDDLGEAVVRQIHGRGGEAIYVNLDVTDESAWDQAVNLAETTFGRLDVLVNNAGIPLRKTLEQTSLAEWNHVFDVNVTGAFLGTKAAVPALRRAGGGSIINTSSTSGIIATTGAAYGSSKGAVRLLTKSTALLYAKEGIRCNSVHPGPLDTEVNRESQQNAAAWAERLRAVPMGRIAQPIEIAYGVLYLASDEASYVTGSELIIDGGSTAI